MAAQVQARERGGWRLECFPDGARLSSDICDKLITLAIAVAGGGVGLPYRRSRHATTYEIRAQAEEAGQAVEAFVKIYDPAGGSGALKSLIRGSRAKHAARIGAALAERGFGVPRVILCGEERRTGRAMLVTERAAGGSLAMFLSAPESPGVGRKREILRAIGAETARLHAAGYIHGDLTPYNVFVASSAPPRFILIDHDRTRRAFPIGRRRRQLRNLVQLFRFDLPRLTATDRMRIFHAWAAGLELQGRKAVMHRAFNMLKLRIARDLGKAGSESSLKDQVRPGLPIAVKATVAQGRAGRAV